MLSGAFFCFSLKNLKEGAIMANKTESYIEPMDQERLTWTELRQAKYRNTVLIARATGLEEKVLGSATMECLKLSFNGVYGYLPKNKIADYEFKGLHNLVGKSFEFIVDEVINEEEETEGFFVANRIKALKIAANRFWNFVEVGQVYEAFIRGVDAFNLYLLVEGVETKIHRTEVGYSMYEDLRGLYTVGDTIDVKILGFEKPSEESVGNIEVSARVLMKDPWKKINSYQLNSSSYLGTVKNLHAEYGMFVELDTPGLIVLCNFPTGRAKMIQRGDEVQVKLTQINVEDRLLRGIAFKPRNNIGAKNQRAMSGLRTRGIRG